MKTKKFSIEEAVDTGFNRTVDNIYFFLTALFIITVIITLSQTGFVLFPSIEDPLFATIIFAIFLLLIPLLIVTITGIGLVKISLTICDGGKAKLSDLFSHYRLFLKFLFTLILYLLITSFGLILFIIPGLIWGTRFSLAIYYVVDQRMGPITALKKSFVDTKGVTLSLLSLLIIMKVALFLNASLISLLSAVILTIMFNLATFGIATIIFTLLLTYPFVYNSMAHVYRKLSTKDSEEVLEEKPTQETEKDLETATS